MPTDPQTWDLRPDQSRKGSGFFGVLARPDGGVSSELSVGVPLQGHETDIPTFVPTLTQDEIMQLLLLREGTPVPQSIVQKSVLHALMRLAAGRPVFARPGEQQFTQYPQFTRVESPTDVPLASSRQSIDPGAIERLLIQRGLGQ